MQGFMTGSEHDNKNLYCLKPHLIFLRPSWPDKIFFVSHHFKVRAWGLTEDITAGLMPIVDSPSNLNCSGKTFQVRRNTPEGHYRVSLCIPWSRKPCDQVHLFSISQSYFWQLSFCMVLPLLITDHILLTKEIMKPYMVLYSLCRA